MPPFFRSLSRILRRAAGYLLIGSIGFVAGGLMLYVFWVRSGPGVQPWHTLTLTEEFSAERAREVSDLAGYLRLEERLFTELDEKVFAQTPTGPSQALVRYSRGSASDPSRWPTNWNRSFELLPTRQDGCALLLHGMSDGPYSLRAFALMLQQRGYRVVGLRMPGHGTIPSGIRTVTWEDMAAATMIGMGHLGEHCSDQPIHIFGYSTGGALALDYSLHALDDDALPVPDTLVLISPAIAVSPFAALMPWIDRLSRLPGLKQAAWTSLLPEFDPFNYNSFSANAVLQVHRMTVSVTRRIRERAAATGPLARFPRTLVLLTAVDATVSPEAASENLLKYLPEGRGALLLYDINRSAQVSPLIVDDPAPKIAQLRDHDALPFAYTLVTNAGEADGRAVARTTPPMSSRIEHQQVLTATWPSDAISLSHVDLGFPPDDPLYGRYRPTDNDRVFLGQLALRGERGVLKLPAQWLMRLRHNPFFDYQQRRVIAWLDGEPMPAANVAPLTP